MRSTYPSPGQHRSIEAFREHWRDVAPDFECVDSIEEAAVALGRPLDLGDGTTLANRFATHPMEGWDGTPDGGATEHTLRRWRRFGESGAALVWGGEAFAVQADGRANPRQLYLHSDDAARATLTRLLAALRDGSRARGDGDRAQHVGLQLTHSGRFARPTGPLVPLVACRDPLLEAKYGNADACRVLTDGELEAIGENFVRAARLAHEVGFDFVDVKCCHGYLLHEVLGARSRDGSYGGSLENRTRLFRRIVDAIRVACPGLGVGVRVSLADTVPFGPDPDSRIGRPLATDGDEAVAARSFGISAEDPTVFDLAEPLAFLDVVRALGIRLVNVTVGSPYYNPHVQRPAAYPPSDGYLPPEDPLASVARHLGVVRDVKRARPDLRFVGTGYTYLQEWLPHVAAAEVGRGHVDVVGLGRMVLVYPDLPRDVLAGRVLQRKLICRTFSDCTTAPRNGMISGCFPLDSWYRELPEAAKLKELKRSTTA